MSPVILDYRDRRVTTVSAGSQVSEVLQERYPQTPDSPSGRGLQVHRGFLDTQDRRASPVRVSRGCPDLLVSQARAEIWMVQGRRTGDHLDRWDPWDRQVYLGFQVRPG